MPAPRGGSRWYVATVARVIARDGSMLERGRPAAHPQVVSVPCARSSDLLRSGSCTDPRHRPVPGWHQRGVPQLVHHPLRGCERRPPAPRRQGCPLGRRHFRSRVGRLRRDAGLAVSARPLSEGGPPFSPAGRSMRAESPLRRPLASGPGRVVPVGERATGRRKWSPDHAQRARSGSSSGTHRRALRPAESIDRRRRLGTIHEEAVAFYQHVGLIAIPGSRRLVRKVSDVAGGLRGE